MRLSTTLRLLSAAALLCSMSSFSGCEKECVRPAGGKDCKKPSTTTTADSTKTGGAN
ncbi:hypothetical protein MUN81_05905 [Hymenobacter sp. 5317J-9]|uniref:hypothetical protein n=1 Tax=Hymenobacter sp. 5317J-9 TaxID=2932250 RepID=UPI001FD6C891|nr:hypothetical protein [Hymenobacter sp. 5317J-9]UOQ99023.1 hypothetical protein MUN81_05905 [Hymenobacter sp. 5317J-9]